MDPDSYLCQLADVFTEVAVNQPTVGSIVALVLAGLLLAASGFVSASEVAFFSLSPSDLNEINERKTKKDDRVAELIGDSEKLLATILISNNFVNVLIIMLCNYAFGQIFDFASPLAEFIVMTVALTFLLLLFGEIMPKIYSVQNTLAFSRVSAPAMTVLKKVFSPLAWILVKTSFFINKTITKQKHNISVDELSQALELTDKKAKEILELLENGSLNQDSGYKQRLKEKFQNAQDNDERQKIVDTIVNMTQSGRSSSVSDSVDNGNVNMIKDQDNPVLDE